MGTTSRIYSVAVVVDDGARKEMRTIEAISHEGEIWLVPSWIEDTARKLRKPARAIRVPGLRIMERKPGDTHDGFVPQPMSKGLLYGHPTAEEAQQYTIVDDPDLAPPRGH